jgi:drug/metabolite transporter (DMT)-like permease
LALLISIAFATATVITRRHAHVKMTPAAFLAMTIACCTAALITAPRLVEPSDFALLFAFGGLNLGLGLSLFVTGARLIPAALAALVGTIEPVLGPVWVWIVHGEIPGSRTLIGGSLVLLALIVHLALELPQQTRNKSSPVAPNEGSV